MDDRTRTILALLLIFGVFIVFQYLGPKPQPQPRKTPEPETVEPRQLSASLEKAPAQAVKVAAPPQVDIREVELSSDGLEVRLSNSGAVVTSCRLKNYPDAKGQPVQLIPDQGRALVLGVNINGRDYDLADHPFQIVEQGPQGVMFRAELEGLTIEKSFRPLDNGLGLLLTVGLRRNDPALAVPRYRLSWGCGLNTTEKDTKLDLREFGAVAMLGRDLVTDKLNKLSKPDLAEIEGQIAFSGVRTKYFLAAMVPPSGRAIAVKQGLAGEHRATSTLSFSVQGEVSDSIKIYLGPIEHNRLARVHPGLDRVADTGWRWLQWISRGILSLLVAVHRVLPNWGVVIIVFSALMKLLFFPLTYTGMKSMKKMQQIQPKLKKIQEQFKNDPGRMNQETMALYKKYGVNPFSGCLPLLIQMPIFFALYQVLVNTIELRQAPFALWLADLSVKDPYYVLPILMGAAMFVQQKLTTVDPKQRMMVYMMPIFMVFIFLNLPAGLNLYWLTNNVLSIGEQYLIHVRTQPLEE